MPPEILFAMQRDFGLDATAATMAVARQNTAGTTVRTLSSQLGDRFGGAIFDAKTGALSVGVTDAALFPLVSRAGAAPTLVKHSVAQLDSMVDRLNAGERAAPRSITAWGVDSVHNTITMTVLPGAATDATTFAAANGVDDVRVIETAQPPRPLYNIRGGDPFYIDHVARCSVGFAVEGGFVTAGHCGRPGNITLGYNQLSQGTFRGSSFPGNDFAWVEVNSNWTPTATIQGLGSISGSTEVATGARVCKSGSTSGVTCGTIESKNQTVRYPQGTVYGLTSTNATCAAGDSGGSFVSGRQAQGTVSGGDSSVCYFFPVNRALNAYGLTLITR